MKENDFFKELENIGILLNEQQKNQFSKYADFLIEYNEHTNLTAIKKREDIYLKHFFDSLLLYKFVKISDEKVLDIGSGAGFPGVPLKIVFPKIKLTLLDSNGKKAKFLEELKDRLNFDFTIINDRAEVYVNRVRESFDIVTSRAVTAMPILSELSLPYVKIGGKFIAYKGQIDDTLENGLIAIKTLGGEVENVYSDIMPIENAARTFVCVVKKCKTDEIYPRKFDKINKKPLQN